MGAKLRQAIEAQTIEKHSRPIAAVSMPTLTCCQCEPPLMQNIKNKHLSESLNFGLAFLSKLVVTSATLVVTSALLVVTRS